MMSTNSRGETDFCLFILLFDNFSGSWPLSSYPLLPLFSVNLPHDKPTPAYKLCHVYSLCLEFPSSHFPCLATSCHRDVIEDLQRQSSLITSPLPSSITTIYQEHTVRHSWALGWAPGRAHIPVGTGREQTDNICARKLQRQTGGSAER